MEKRLAEMRVVETKAEDDIEDQELKAACFVRFPPITTHSCVKIASPLWESDRICVIFQNLFRPKFPRMGRRP